MSPAGNREALVPADVLAYSGARGEEEPRAMWHDGCKLDVREILARWREPAGRYFRVSTGDGHVHLLFCRERDSTWWIVVTGRELHRSG